MSDSYLQSLVTNKCNALGVDAAAEFFSVSPGLVRQWLAGSKTPSLAAVELVFQSPSVSGITTADAQWAGKDLFARAIRRTIGDVHDLGRRDL